MLIVITGGSGSGKSAFAEQQILRFPRPYIYIATMKPFGAESRTKIERHQRMRAEKGFTTLECYEDLKEICLPAGSAVLLECMSNLTANVQYGEGRPSLGSAEVQSGILEQVMNLRQKAEHLIIVTNEVFSDSMRQYEMETQEYIRSLGGINQKLAELAEEYYEVVYGIPLQRKHRIIGEGES